MAQPFGFASAVEQEGTPLIGNPHLLHRFTGALGLAAVDAVTDGSAGLVAGGLQVSHHRRAVLVERIWPQVRRRRHRTGIGEVVGLRSPPVGPSRNRIYN